MFSRLREDIAAVKERDPAATSSASILINYPGVQAVCAHRFQHFLWRRGRRGLARFLSQCTRFFTGIEIHPGAQFGRRVFIDHGMGVIVGETAVVGDDVTLFQGVTLGGTGKEQGKRHPNVENGATIGVGAAVLGNVTIGARSKVGGGAVVVDDVPPDCTVVGVPGHVVVQNGVRVSPADPFRREILPDPVEERLSELLERVTELEARSLAISDNTTNEELARLSARLDSLEAELDHLLAAQGGTAPVSGQPSPSPNTTAPTPGQPSPSPNIPVSASDQLQPSLNAAVPTPDQPSPSPNAPAPVQADHPSPSPNTTVATGQQQAESRGGGSNARI